MDIKKARQFTSERHLYAIGKRALDSIIISYPFENMHCWEDTTDQQAKTLLEMIQIIIRKYEVIQQRFVPREPTALKSLENRGTKNQSRTAESIALMLYST